jgi:protein-disulfide isomerase
MNASQKQKRRSRRGGSQQSPQSTTKQHRKLKPQEEIQQKQVAEMQFAAKRLTIKRAMLWSGLLFGLILLVLGLIYFTKGPTPETATRLANATPPETASQPADSTPAEATPQPTNPTSALGWALGNPNASTVLVEFSDYQCPRCADYHPIIKRLTEELGTDFLLIFRYYPLRQHDKAILAAASAEAAGRQGKFWEMHDLLFIGQKMWSEKTPAEAEKIFVQYAISLNLSVEQFQSALHYQEILDKITADYQTGRASGVTGTPAFFLKGQKITDLPQTYEAFKDLILQGKKRAP